MSGIIKQQVGVSVRLGCAPERSVLATFAYSASDPFRVHLILTSAAGEAVSWPVSRELLAEGCDQAQVLGWVKVRPDAGTVVIDAFRDGRRAVFRATLFQVRAFLVATYRAVCPDVENPCAGMLPTVEEAIDREIDRMFGEVR